MLFLGTLGMAMAGLFGAVAPDRLLFGRTGFIVGCAGLVSAAVAVVSFLRLPGVLS